MRQLRELCLLTACDLLARGVLAWPTGFQNSAVGVARVAQPDTPLARIVAVLELTSRPDTVTTITSSPHRDLHGWSFEMK